MTVIARLDRAIQRKALDSPVKPENDKQTKLCRHTNANDRISIMITYDASDMKRRVAGEVRGFEAEKYLSRKEINRLDLFVHYAVAVAVMAAENAGLVELKSMNSQEST